MRSEGPQDSVWLWQWQNSSGKIFCTDIACYFAAAAAAQYEHFGPTVVKMTLKTVAAVAPCERTLIPVETITHVI